MTTRELRLVTQILKKTRQNIFIKTHLPEILNSPRCRLLGKLPEKFQPEKQPPLSRGHTFPQLQWAKNHTRRDMNLELFAFEIRGTLIGPYG